MSVNKEDTEHWVLTVSVNFTRAFAYCSGDCVLL